MSNPSDTCIFHIVTREQVAAVLSDSTYTSPSLANEGFMHFCSAHQVKNVVATFYPLETDLKLLVVDVSLLRSELRYEPAAPGLPEQMYTEFFASQMFPHLYGPLDVDAIIDVIEVERFNGQNVHGDTAAMLRHYRFDRLPVEGTLFKSTWRAELASIHDGPAGTAMIGLYANQPQSLSCFHKLDYDEVWHVYGGDAFTLFLLFPGGRSTEITMGPNLLAGEKVQFVVPAGVWQAGCLNQGGRYALFGCTMAPGFTGTCFEAGTADELIALYPKKAEIINKLSVNGHQKMMPQGFAQ